jgi:hypothetical protein
MTDKKIPVLTELVSGPHAQSADAAPGLSVEELAELQARIATRGYALMERLLHESLREMEANLFADVIGRLRAELPDLIEEVLHQHFGSPPDRGPPGIN